MGNKCQIFEKQNNKLLQYIFYFLMIFGAFVVIGKNSLLYSYSSITEQEFNSEIMQGYCSNGLEWEPLENPNIVISGQKTLDMNEVEIVLSKGLVENANVYLYTQNKIGESILVEKKSIRKGFNRISFHTEVLHNNDIIIKVLSKDDSRYQVLPNGNINIKMRYYNPVQKKITWILTVCVLAFLAMLLACAVMLNRMKYPERVVKERASNIELLRIVCMLCLIGNHYAVHGGLLLLEPDSFPQRIGRLLLPLGKICFVTFVAISMWFLCDVSYVRFSRFMKTWLETLLYSVGFTFITYNMGGIVSPSDFVSSFFVMLGNSHGFAASYLIFLLLLPFVVKATHNISKFQARYLLIILCCIQVIVCILGGAFNYLQPISSEVTLFILCYVIMLNLKRWQISSRFSTVLELLCILGTCVLTYWGYGIAYRGGNVPLLNELLILVQDESSLLYIASGFSLFFLAKKIHIPYCKWINQIAKVTFGILLIHDHNFFRSTFWHECIRTQVTYHSIYLPIIVVITVLLTYYALGVIDWLRQELLEKWIVNSKAYSCIFKKMDKVLNENLS